MENRSLTNKVRRLLIQRGIILGLGVIFLFCSFALPLVRAAEETTGEKKEEKAVEKKEEGTTEKKEEGAAQKKEEGTGEKKEKEAVTPAEEKGEKAKLDEVSKAVPQGDFASMVERMTRRKKLYSINTFDTLLDVKVVYKSPALRSAFVQDYSAMSLYSPQEKALLLDKEEQAAAAGEEFLVAIFTTDPDWSVLSKGDPAWHLYLYDDQDRRLEPFSIGKASISAAEIWKFYPREITPWTRLYRVTFPKKLPSSDEPFIGPDTRKIKLVFAGVLGRAEVEWDLK